MNTLSTNQLTIPKETIAEVRAQLAAGEPVRLALPGGGRLHIDRPLPFLCVYRTPIDRDDRGTRELVSGEASFLIVPGQPALHKSLDRLIKAIVEVMQERFGAFLILEVWSASDATLKAARAESELEPTELRPSFLVATKSPKTPLRTVDSLRRHLEPITHLRQPALVVADDSADSNPPNLQPLLSWNDSKSLHCETIGLCVRPIYHAHDTGVLYPAVLRSLRRKVSKALKHTFFTFAKTRTTARPEHYYSLGRRFMVKAVYETDQALTDVSDAFSFLLQVTPVNAEAAWNEFQRSRFDVTPKFYYRPLAVDPGVLKRRLFNVRIEKIEDPTLSELFRQRQDELDRKITMMTDINTPRFILGSQQVYGDVEPSLVSLATSLLEQISPRCRDETQGGVLTPTEFARLAEQEIAYYREQLPVFKASVVLREDMFSGLMCSNGNLLIGSQALVPKSRAEALLQHEVGTHLLTYYNGLVESFHLLHSGFAGYEPLQEGLAVVSEFLVGGLSRPRMRLLAARVLAAHLLLEGASFLETFRTLDREYDFSQRTAYTVSMRIYRGGGLTKDAVYLRGLVEVLNYFAAGGDLEPLLIGKIAMDHIGLVRELIHRKLIQPPALKPRYLQLPGVQERIQQLAQGMTVLDLIQDK